MTSPAQATLRGSLLAPFREELGSQLRDLTRAAEPYGPAFTELWILTEQQILGGKLIRPQLFLDAYGALEQPADPVLTERDIVKLAVAIELLHFSYLLHDDVIDGDLKRRGHPNLVAVLGDRLEARGVPRRHRDIGHLDALHWGRTGAILMGDLLLSAVHQIFARICAPEHIRIALLDLLDHTIRETVAGEYLDVGLSDGAIQPHLSTVLSMSAYKTASYTFQLPLKAAAIVAQQPSELEREMAAIGRHLGLAYQLQDDLLSVFGQPQDHGKDAFSDLREGKQTAIICYARHTSCWPQIEQDFGDPHLAVEQGENLRELLSECGAREFVEGLIAVEIAGVEHKIAADGPHSLPEELRDVIHRYGEGLKGRAA